MNTVRKRVPVFVGATTLGTRETILRLEYAREAGADGTLLGLPMWQPCTEEIAVRFYASISEALPDFPIIVYANEHAFRFDFPPSFWARVVKHAPTAIAAKFMKPQMYLDCLKACDGKINLLPMPEMARRFVEQSPSTVTAVWATSASMGPAPIVALMDSLRRKDVERFEKIAADLEWCGEPIMRPGGVISELARYNIQFEKLRFEVSGYCKPGPCRPPYDILPEHHAAATREHARRWVEISKRYKPR
jgi:dihydrodipicolinate synthase/N-acetylneuraminate lyase